MALTSTACTSGSSEAKKPAAHASADEQPELSPALTRQEARAAIERYARVNNKANTGRDRALLATIEDGPLYAMSAAEYQQTDGLTRSERKPYQPWSYDAQRAELYIPRISSGQPRWFAAALASSKNQIPDQLAVFAQQPHQQRWALVSVADLYGRNLPKVVLDAGGYATTVAANRSKSLAVGADRLRRGVLDNFATGGRGSGKKKIFAASRASSQQVKVHNETVSQYGSQGSSIFTGAPNRYRDTYALKTIDGGALVFFSHTHHQTDTVARPGLRLDPGKEDRAWLHDIPRTRIRYTFVCNNAATVPAKTGPATLLAYTCARTHASGPPANPAPPPRA
ncbi:hypothetical protein [Streptomyces typhae]|uniref:hypothetical protein n=1 Tax=Streptomyces typhae TaxID=2681492 RepID=UPI0031B5939B